MTNFSSNRNGLPPGISIVQGTAHQVGKNLMEGRGNDGNEYTWDPTKPGREDSNKYIGQKSSPWKVISNNPNTGITTWQLPDGRLYTANVALTPTSAQRNSAALSRASGDVSIVSPDTYDASNDNGINYQIAGEQGGAPVYNPHPYNPNYVPLSS